MKKIKDAKWRILALLLLGGLSFLSAHLEGYLDLILDSAKFKVFFAAVFVGCILTAFYMNGKTKYFLWLFHRSFNTDYRYL